VGRFLSVVFVALWALSGIAQYGSEEGPYAAVSLHLSCQLTTPGTCEQPAEGLVRCRVPAGTEGTLLLTANVAPSTHWVDIAAVTLPPWATFTPAPGYGTAQATCSFLPPPEAAGGTFELRFRASTAYAVSAELPRGGAGGRGVPHRRPGEVLPPRRSTPRYLGVRDPHPL